MAQQQQEASGRARPKKKFREIEPLRNKNNESLGTFVSAETVSPPRVKRESMFDTPVDGASYGNEQSGTSTTVRPMSEHTNPIADGIMAMMTTPQSMQQVVILSEIFNRPKYD